MVAIEIIEESPLQIAIVIKKEKIEELGNCCNKIKFIFNLALEGSNRIGWQIERLTIRKDWSTINVTTVLILLQ